MTTYLLVIVIVSMLSMSSVFWWDKFQAEFYTCASKCSACLQNVLNFLTRILQC